MLFVVYFMDHDGVVDVYAVFESEAEMEAFLEAQEEELSYEEAMWGEAVEVSPEEYEALMREYGE